jgi:hypothetical protein
VAIKEYMPASLVGRTATMAVSLRSAGDAEVFALGLRSFVNEARLLARFDHPSLIKVHRFFEANGTAYMAMPVLHGRTLKQLRLAPQPGEPPLDETRLRGLLEPLLGALEKLHEAGVFHRDIAPDNIVVEPDGRPVLLDFGAARRVIGDHTQTLTAILKPAYAPVEQYAEAGSVKQGPWTDLYALGATLHHLLLGRPPEPATARALSDDAPPLATRAIGGCSEAFLRTVDWMLAPRPADRPQSVAALREALDGRRPAPALAAGAWQRTQAGAGGSAGSATTLVELPLEATAPPSAARLAAVAAPAASSAPSASSARAVGAPAAPPTPATARRGPGVAVGVGIALAAAVGIAAFAFWPDSATESAPASLAAPASAPAAASAPLVAAPGPVAAPVAVPVPPSAAGVTAEPAAAAGPASAPAVRRSPAPAVAVRSGSPSAAATPSANPSATPLATGSPAGIETARPEGGAATAPPTPPSTAPVPTPATPPLSAPPATAPAAPALGPEARCATRDNPIRRFACMERLCLRSEFRSHPDCLQWRREARPRE